MKKSVSQTTEQNAASKAAPSIIPDSPWTEDDISIRKGNCNVLLIAPHGHPKNDEKTYDITRLAANELDCYSIVTEIYRKPFKKKGSNERRSPDKTKKWVDLNRKNQVQEHLESEFEKPLRNIVDEIIETAGKALVIWIHGIGDGNLSQTNGEGNNIGIDALIGIGQGNPDRITAYRKTTNRITSVLETNPHNPLKAVLAKKGSNYCGHNKNIMNQYFRTERYSLKKVESVQIEIGKNGFREAVNFQDTAMALANSLFGLAIRFNTESEQIALDSADQKDSMPQIQVGEIDLENGQFMSRLNDITSEKIEFKRLADSIKRHGILNPIIVRKRNNTNGKPYQMISGFRRLTALRASIHENDFDGATVPARVLDDSVSDDKAYQISFTENLARQDLSLWEIARACAEIKGQKKNEGSLSSGEIEAHLANLIQKDARTVRRYLKLASIENDDIREAVHTGSINYLDAIEIGKNDLEQNDISALLGHLASHPKATRAFKRFHDNLEHCCDRSGLPMATVLGCKNADSFLSLEKQELENRIEHLHIKTGKAYSEILQGKAGSLTKESSMVDAGLENKLAASEFQNQNQNLVDMVTEAFSKSKINGKFKIRPVLNSAGNQVSVTITAPETEIWQAIDAVSRTNNSSGGKVIRKRKPKRIPSKSASSASSINGNSDSIAKDVSKGMHGGKISR